MGTQNAQGSGPNKKLAKRAAAENMLQLLGYSRPQPQPGKSAIKTDGANSDPDKTRKASVLCCLLCFCVLCSCPFVFSLTHRFIYLHLLSEFSNGA